MNAYTFTDLARSLVLDFCQVAAEFDDGSHVVTREMNPNCGIGLADGSDLPCLAVYQTSDTGSWQVLTAGPSPRVLCFLASEVR